MYWFYINLIQFFRKDFRNMVSGQIAETNVRMSLVIPKELKAKLDTYAKAQDRSTNKIITYAIEEYLENHSQQSES